MFGHAHADFSRTSGDRLPLIGAAILACSVLAGVLTIVNPFLPIGAAASGLAFLWAIGRPRQGLLLLLLLIPFGTFLKRLQYAFVPASQVWTVNNPLTFVPEGIFYGLILAAVGSAVRGRTWRAASGLGRWLDYAVACFIIVALLGSIRPGLSPLTGLLGFRSGYVFVAMYFVAATILGNHVVPFRRIVHTIVGAGIVVALYGIKQYLFGLYAFEDAWIASGGEGAGQLQVTFLGDVRTFSTLASPAGYYLLIPFLISLGVALWRPHGFSALWAACAALVIGLEIFLSTAKSAIVLMAVGTLVGAGLTLTRSVWSMPSVLTVLSLAIARIGAGLADALATMIPDRALAESARFAADPANAPTLVSRVDQIRAALDIVARSPLGVGLASTGGVVLFGESLAARITDNTLETYYGRIAAELGAPGLMAIGGALSLCVAMGTIMFARARHNRARFEATCFLLVAVAGTMSGIGWEVLGIKESAILFWFVMGWMRAEWNATRLANL